MVKSSLRSGDGHDTPDGTDKDGFSGGDKRLNVWPTTFESAKQALLDFVPQSQRREYEDILGDVFMEMESEEENDEEE